LLKTNFLCIFPKILVIKKVVKKEGESLRKSLEKNQKKYALFAIFLLAIKNA